MRFFVALHHQQGEKKMFIDDKGIVLRCVKYDDKSFIAHLFTASRGYVSFIINGSHGKRSSTSARLFQPLAFLSFQWDMKHKASLQRMKEARLLFVQQEIPLHPIKRSIAMLLAEFMAYILREETSNADLYLYIEHSFQWFSASMIHFVPYECPDVPTSVCVSVAVHPALSHFAVFVPSTVHVASLLDLYVVNL